MNKIKSLLKIIKKIQTPPSKNNKEQLEKFHK